MNARRVDVTTTALTTQTARTILDAPLLPLFDEEEIRWQRIKAEHDRLMSLPGVVAILNALAVLTVAQRERLSTLWLAHFGIHKAEQTRTHHRISKHDPGMAMRYRAVKDAVWQLAAGDEGLNWSGAHAAADAAFAAACGDLLDADEIRLFTKPWMDGTR